MDLRTKIMKAVVAYEDEMDTLCVEVFDTIIRPWCHKHNALVGVNTWARYYRRYKKGCSIDSDEFEDLSEYQYVKNFEAELSSLFIDVPGEWDIDNIISYSIYAASGKIKNMDTYSPTDGFV